MEKGIIITLGLIIGYLLFRFINRKQKSPTDAYSNMSEMQSISEHAQKSLIFDMSELQSNSEHAQKSTISDILTNDKYKVKGQWDR